MTRKNGKGKASELARATAELKKARLAGAARRAVRAWVADVVSVLEGIAEQGRALQDASRDPDGPFAHAVGRDLDGAINQLDDYATRFFDAIGPTHYIPDPTSAVLGLAEE